MRYLLDLYRSLASSSIDGSSAVGRAQLRTGCGHATSNEQHATSNMQRATCNEQRATSNMQRATSNEQHATSNEQRATYTILLAGLSAKSRLLNPPLQAHCCKKV
jgi:hypothetical protein